MNTAQIAEFKVQFNALLGDLRQFERENKARVAGFLQAIKKDGLEVDAIGLDSWEQELEFQFHVDGGRATDRLEWAAKGLFSLGFSLAPPQYIGEGLFPPVKFCPAEDDGTPAMWILLVKVPAGFMLGWADPVKNGLKALERWAGDNPKFSGSVCLREAKGDIEQVRAYVRA